jgi:hypothetical protein
MMSRRKRLRRRVIGGTFLGAAIVTAAAIAANSGASTPPPPASPQVLSHIAAKNRNAAAVDAAITRERTLENLRQRVLHMAQNKAHRRS